MEKFQNKYRVSSFRLKNWNYCSEGDCFITICTQNMEHYFGKIENAKMQLLPVGVIADILWHQIPYHSKNVELGAFVVMPNHIHFQWQTRFYDHIIRNDKSFQNISKYIHNNPANWQNDNFLK